MAASDATVISAPVLSQKQRRAALRKGRRKRKRQALAQAREIGLENGESHTFEEAEEEDDDEEEDETTKKERQRLHEEWLERERLAQEEFKLKCEREEAAKKRKEEEERMIKEEWEAQQRREQEEEEKKQQKKRDRERKSLTSTFRSHNRDEAVQKRLDEAESQLENGGPWMNPEAPVTENSENYGTERDVANCPFFLKTGACRFGDRCSRKHDYPASSPTLMIRSMFITFGMEQSRRDDYEMDAGLEHSEEDLQEHFLDFYHDVLPEFRSVGKVVQFKVSCNYESHLRGNVYIQFDTEEQCKEAFIKFHGRWYAGRQLHCEFCPVTRWKNAICGLFDRQKCPKGKHCNFLHVFRNPGNEFWEADRDLHLSPDASVRRSRRDGWHSERYGDRSWRQRRSSRSPPRSERSHSRPEGERWRSRSRDRRASHQQREERRGSRSRYSDRSRARYRSRSRDKSRSRSRDRDRRRKRSRDTDREYKYRSVSEGRDSGGEDSDGSGRSRNRSPKKDNQKEKTPKGDGSTHRRHKHSKKSKKKSKKKHKKKKDEGATSSGESEKEYPSSPSPEVKETEQHQGDDRDGKSAPEGTSDCPHTQVKAEPGENGNISTS